MKRWILGLAPMVLMLLVFAALPAGAQATFTMQMEGDEGAVTQVTVRIWYHNAQINE